MISRLDVKLQIKSFSNFVFLYCSSDQSLPDKARKRSQEIESSDEGDFQKKSHKQRKSTHTKKN